MSNWIPTTNNTFDAHAEVFDSATDPEVRITLGTQFDAESGGQTDTLRSFVVQTERYCVTGYLVQQHIGGATLCMAGNAGAFCLSLDFGQGGQHRYSLRGDGISVVCVTRDGDEFGRALTALYEWAARYARTHLGVAA